MAKSNSHPIYAIGLPRNLKKLELNHIDLISKIALAKYYPQGLASELLSLRGTPGTMINISQIEKFTEFGARFGPPASGEAATPGLLPQKLGKNICCGGEPAEFTFAASCVNKTGEKRIGRSCSQGGPATIILSP